VANTILAKFLTVVTPTFSFGSVANAAGRIAAEIDNTSVRATRGQVSVRLKTGAVAPTAGSLYKVYLIRNSNDATNIQGGRGGTALGTADAAVSVEPVNAECVGAVTLTASTATTFDEVFPVQDPGPKFSFVVWNASGQTVDTTNGNHVLQWSPIVDEVQ
jgi:hypothetical protein